MSVDGQEGPQQIDERKQNGVEESSREQTESKNKEDENLLLKNSKRKKSIRIEVSDDSESEEYDSSDSEELLISDKKNNKNLKSSNLFLKSQIKSYWPNTITQWRWGIQSTSTMALTLPFMFGPWNDKYFNGDAMWISMAGALVIESSVGGSFARMIDRFLATLLTGVWVLSMLEIFQLIFANDTNSVQWGIYCTNPIAALIFSWSTAVFPNRYTFHTYSVGYLPIFESSMRSTKKVARSVAFKVANIILGITISFFVIRLILPRTAAEMLRSSLSLSLRRLANCLEQNCLLQSQLISRISPEVFQADDNLAAAARLSSPTKQKFKRKKKKKDLDLSAGPSPAELWSEMNSGFRQLTEFGVNIRSARHEFRLFSVPHFVPIKPHLDAFESLTTLYTQVATLIASLDLDYPQLSDIMSPDQKKHDEKQTGHRFSKRLDSMLDNLKEDDFLLMSKGLHPSFLLSKIYVPDVLSSARIASKWIDQLATNVLDSINSEEIYDYERRLSVLTSKLSRRLLEQDYQLARIMDSAITKWHEPSSRSEIFFLLNKYLVASPSIYSTLSSETKIVFWQRFKETRHKIHVVSESLSVLSRSLRKTSRVITSLVDTYNQSRRIFSRRE